MRSGHAATMAFTDGPRNNRSALKQLAHRLGGLALALATIFATAALATWNVADPSFSYATGNEVTNAAGYPGAVFADLAMQFFGLAAVAVLVPALAWGYLFLSGRGIDMPGRRGLSWFGGALAAAGATATLPIPPSWPLPLGLGGVIGDVVLKVPGLLSGGYPTGFLAVLSGLVLAPLAVVALLYGAGVLWRATPAAASGPARRPQDDDEDLDDDEGGLALGALTHWWLSAKAFARRRLSGLELPRTRWSRAHESFEDDDAFETDPLAGYAPGRERTGGDMRVEPGFGAPHDERQDASDMDEAPFDEDDDLPAILKRSQPRIAAPAPRPKASGRVQREAQASLLKADRFELPALHYLSEPKNVARDPNLTRDALEQNARMLEGVLDDFGVKGEIINVRPGPVVTLYELEPAPGIKSSRVISLADDIARSMSAIAARVAVVPGRNAIGIELPNSTRETVYLREILGSKDFETTKAKLGLALGKTINGESVVTDLTRMPHLLVAGTTGSGKSVAINTMILSLVFHMTPEQCRLIMIDPKMLELSVYDGIPHLLTPVVTDPKKAVVALKWTVREMEDRYRKMSKVGVRNIDGYNQRIAEAKKTGERISRTVQTGFDRQTGEAIYETEELNLESMPYIVVIIDEMADLMMVAGKDIEGAVQRLAQMARAAGIHVIMATQRPSVDVITGTIKANFPTRISFQVTSKIDSRTILGEQGAEQLLGMGDMLYMAGGGRIQRVHGPFVSDAEVERVVKHLKLQGAPQYLDAITQDDEDDEDAMKSGGGEGYGGESDDPYDQAVAVVLRDGKASTSYIQRRLGIGYNRAASIIEKMEREGIVGPANHAGKREILVPTEQDKM